ncbi:hypothetical protein EJ04DRAFT_296406 [Polyplosphaeria fusca]|uniref:Uncharacterized protein n=1 Tax=Polyplosphaeria fusca TaxID=682080 RepID=A0A9P4QXL8_9PLEO|nr:hypothetical protein EJ04DRAFT_296406 [Polyplosphaeria fusca]
MNESALVLYTPSPEVTGQIKSDRSAIVSAPETRQADSEENSKKKKKNKVSKTQPSARSPRQPEKWKFVQKLGDAVDGAKEAWKRAPKQTDATAQISTTRSPAETPIPQIPPILTDTSTLDPNVPRNTNIPRRPLVPRRLQEEVDHTITSKTHGTHLDSGSEDDTPAPPPKRSQTDGNTKDQVPSNATWQALLHIAKAGNRHINLQAAPTNDIERAVRHVLDKYNLLDKDLRETRNAVQSLRRENVVLKESRSNLDDFKKALDKSQTDGAIKDTEIARLRGVDAELTELKKRFDSLKDTLSLKEEESQDFKTRYSKLKANMKNLETSHATQLAEVRRGNSEKIRSLEQQAQGLRRDFDAVKKNEIDLRHDFDLQWNKREQNHQTELEQLEASYGRKVHEELESQSQLFNEEKAQLNNSMITANSQHQDALTQVKKTHEFEKAGLHAQINTYRDQLEDERWQSKQSTDELKLQHAQAMSAKETEHSRAFQSLQTSHNDTLIEQRKRDKQEYEERTRTMQENYEDLKTKLVARDHFKGLRDPELGTKFSQLARLIDEFARVRWDDGRQQSWPFSENELKKFDRENAHTRMIKKQIIQNSLWIVLADEVFPMPFNCMGEEGRQADVEWERKFGRNESSTVAPDWPVATGETERARYEKAKAFLESLRKGNVTEEDIRRRTAFNRRTADVVHEISVAVGKVAPLGFKEQQKLKELVDMAGKLWLETCCQRFRIIVWVPPESEDSLTKLTYSHTSLTLCVRPALRRFGNAQGVDLDREDIVGNWQQVSEPYRLA